MPSVITGAHRRLQIPAPVKVKRRDAVRGVVAIPAEWRDWLRIVLPDAAEPGERHAALWRWVWAVQPLVRPRPFIAIWPRGGGKSTTAELACLTLLMRGVRRYALYVSGTQEQADKHVETIGAILERLGVERAVNKYGNSKGWRRSRLKTATFTIDAFGLDTGARGTKDEDQRPDMLIFDDVDQIHDSAATTRKRIETLTMTLLPAATDTAAILGVQNLIHGDSVFAQLADDRADWLSDRIVSGPHPALLDCAIERIADAAPDAPKYRVSGVPTWVGQDVAACQRLINTIGPDAFRRESQHEVGGTQHAIYADIPTYCPIAPLPAEWSPNVGLDFGGIHTCAVMVAQAPDGRLWAYAEYLAGDASAEEHAQAILALHNREPFCVGGSRSEGQWRREFRRGGLPVASPQFSEVEVGIDRVRGALASGDLVISEACVGLLNDLRTYRRAPDAHGKPTKEIVNKSDYHYADALRYIVGRLR